MGRFIATRAAGRRNYNRIYAGTVRYWRIVEPAVGAFGFRVMELGLTEADEADLQSLMAGNASTNVSATSGSANSIVDGNNNTSGLWQGFPHSPEFTWEVDLGAGNERYITKLRYMGYSTNDYAFTSCRVDYSEDGVTWITQGNVSGMVSWPGSRVWTDYYPIE